MNEDWDEEDDRHETDEMSQQFETLAKIGSGSFGTVFKGNPYLVYIHNNCTISCEVRRVADNNIYVIKNIRIKELASREQYEAINEVQILSKMESPYVVQYFDSFIANNNLNIVMEYCNKGDLQKMIKKAQSKNLRSLGEASTWNIILQVFMINIIFAFIIFKNILMQINACMYVCTCRYYWDCNIYTR